MAANGMLKRVGWRILPDFEMMADVKTENRESVSVT
jgi:hypothetical protein